MASLETFLTVVGPGGRRCPPSNKLWYQRYMQVQFAPGNCCPEICLCNQQLLQAFVQVSLAPGNCCPEFAIDHEDSYICCLRQELVTLVSIALFN